MGIFISIIFGIIFSLVFYLAKENLFNGQNKAIFKGSIAWFAGILITILAFAMLRYKGWETKIKRKLEGMAQQVRSTAQLCYKPGFVNPGKQTDIADMQPVVNM
jgi:hypothetical protein